MVLNGETEHPRKIISIISCDGKVKYAKSHYSKPKAAMRLPHNLVLKLKILLQEKQLRVIHTFSCLQCMWRFKFDWIASGIWWGSSLNCINCALGMNVKWQTRSAAFTSKIITNKQFSSLCQVNHYHG